MVTGNKNLHFLIVVINGNLTSWTDAPRMDIERQKGKLKGRMTNRKEADVNCRCP